MAREEAPQKADGAVSGGRAEEVENYQTQRSRTCLDPDDSAMDYPTHSALLRGEGAELGGKGAPGGGVVLRPPPSGQASPQAALPLGKTLVFSDLGLEADFLAEMASQNRPMGVRWFLLRMLVWVGATVQMAASGAVLDAVVLALTCLLPAVVQLVATAWGFKQNNRNRWHAVLSMLCHVASSLFGLLAVQRFFAAHGSSAPLHGYQHLACHGAAYLVMGTAASSAPFIMQFVGNTLILLMLLFAIPPTLCTQPLAAAAPEQLKSTGELLASISLGPSCCQLACFSTITLAYCIPLYRLYWKEARQRVAYARNHGLHANTSLLDPLDPLCFLVPAVAQAFQIRSYW